MTEAGNKAFSRLSFTLGIVFILVGVGESPEISGDSDDLSALPEDVRDFWGYRKLADQIGHERAFIIASLIENSSYPDLIRSIITIESVWDVDAVSNREARGLMQIRMIAAQEIDSTITPQDLIEPMTNVELGIQIFEEHMDYFDRYNGAEHWALTSYNRGRYGTFQLEMKPPTTDYSRKVLELTNQL